MTVRRSCGALAAAMTAGAASAALAAAPTLGVYRCGGERQVVPHCAERCEVDYPDRPERNGFQVQMSEPADALAARLAACQLIAGPNGEPLAHHAAMRPGPPAPAALAAHQAAVRARGLTGTVQGRANIDEPPPPKTGPPK